MKTIIRTAYKTYSTNKFSLRHYVRAGSKNAEDTRGVIKKAISGTPILNSNQKVQVEEGTGGRNLIHRFNLFENVGQAEETNFSTSICSGIPSKTFPFNSRHADEILKISKALLKDNNNNKLLPVIILMGPNQPVSQSKFPYLSFTQQLAKELDAQMIDLPLDKLRKLAQFTNPQRIPNSEDSFFHSVDNLNTRANFKRTGSTLNTSSVYGYLQSIRSIWSWIQDSLERSFPGNRILFMRGLAELLDTQTPFRHEVILFLRNIKQGGTLIIDGVSSSTLKTSPPHAPPVRKEKSSLEQLIASIQNYSFTNTRLLPTDEPKVASFQKALDDYVNRENPAPVTPKKEATQEKEERSIVIAEAIVWAPLGLPIEGGVTKLGRATAQKESQNLIKLLEDDKIRHVSLEQYQLISSELAKLANTNLPESLDEKQITSLISTNIHTITNLNRSHIQRILLTFPSKDETVINFDNLIEALKSLNLQSPSITNPATSITQQEFTKHESRFVNAIITPVSTRFDDIGALQGTKQALYEIITLPLHRPDLYSTGVNKDTVSGVLLFGAPGTGKTMLAKAVAAESGFNFITVTSSTINDMYVGEGEKNGLFSLARKISPCVIFIDEVDSLLENRSSLNVRASRTEIINEFMSEWDGLLSLDSGQSSVIVMGATNRPFVLDDAVLRRLPRRLHVDLPDQQARLAILKVITKDDVLEDSTHLQKLSEMTSFYSGSDLKNLAKSAATSATRDLLSMEKRTGRRLSVDARVIKWTHWEQAMKEVPASLNKESDMIKRLRKWNDIYGDRTQSTTNDIPSSRNIGFQ